MWKNFKWLSIIPFFIIFFTNSLFSLTLDEAIKIALENNFYILSEKYKNNAYFYKYKASNALKMPVFFIQSKYTKLDREKNINFSTPLGSQSIKLSEQDYIDFSTGIKLNLYTGGYIYNTIKKSLYEKNASRYELEEAKLNIKYNTSIAYLNILELESFQKIALSHLKALKKHYNDTLNFYKQGIVPYLDVIQTEVKLKEAKQNLTSINNSIKVAKTNLSLIMGKGPVDNFTVKTINKNFIKKFNINLLYKIAKNRPILKAFSNKIQIANAQVNIASSEYKPKIYILGGYNYSNMQKNVTNKGDFLIQAGINFKLDWSKGFHDVEAAKNRKFSIINAKKELYSNIMLNVKKAFEEYSSAVDNLNVARSTVESAKEYFRSIKLKYKEGLADNSDVLDGEAMLVKALMSERTDYFNILKKYFLIERVIGKEVDNNE